MSLLSLTDLCYKVIMTTVANMIDPFSNYEVPSEAKLENFPSVGPHRLSFDSATFMESGRTQAPQAVL